MKTYHSFQSCDGKNSIQWILWEPEKTPIAVLQIVHGMCEYIDCYDEFARYMTQFGFAVAGDDHLGHGRTAKDGDLGYMGEKDGWKNMAEDVDTLHSILREKYPGMKVFILGHSMGSFILRTWMAFHGDRADKIIIMGTAGKNPAAVPGLAAVKLFRAIRGSRAKLRLLDVLCFGSYGKRIPNPLSEQDWTCTDEKVIRRHLEDPFCAFTFTTAAYEDLMHLMLFINSPRWYQMVPKEKPILVTAGTEDPVGSYGKGPEEVYNGLLQSGCRDVRIKLYEGMRHEVLYEINHQQVFEDIKDFLLEGIDG